MPEAGTARDTYMLATNLPGDFRVALRTADGQELSADHAEPGSVAPAPDPFDLLYASLLSCVLITVRMYATRKNWPLDMVQAELIPRRTPPGPLEGAELRMRFDGASLTDEQRARLLDIAGKCPVHRTLSAGVDISHTMFG